GSEIVERIAERARRQRVAKPEARIVGRDHMKMRQQRRDEPVPHPRRGRKSMQKQQRRLRRVASLLKMDSNAVHDFSAKADSVVACYGHADPVRRPRYPYLKSGLLCPTSII